MSDQTLLVGTAGTRIYTCRLTASGQLQLLHETATGNGTSWLLVRENYLYTTNETDGQIETFSIDDRLAGKLTSKGKASSHGSSPCSMDIDPTGQWLAVAK
jgi:6-phosphogluconolactonase (cycloisomerase 2 family)